MARIKTLLASCGRGPIAATAIITTTAAAFCLGLLAAAPAGEGGPTIQPVQEGQDWADMDPEDMMAMMAQMGQPGQEHEELAVFVGQWDTKMESLAPGMEAFNTAGTATFEPVMGGRFIKQSFSGTMMGQPMNGVGLTGYNKASKTYEGVWYDSMNTAIHMLTGEKTGTGWAYTGEETDPMSGETFEYRHAIEMDGDDKFTFTMQHTPEVAAMMGVQAEDGQAWVDSFRIHYTRKGAGDAAGGRTGGGGNAGNGNRR